MTALNQLLALRARVRKGTEAEKTLTAHLTDPSPVTAHKLFRTLVRDEGMAPAQAEKMAKYADQTAHNGDKATPAQLAPRKR